MTFNHIGELAVLTLRDPQSGYRALQGLDLPRPARWMALALAVALSAVLAGLARWIFPVPVEGAVSRLIAQPWLLAVVQFIALSGSAWLMAWVGRMFGGKGQFDDALLVVGWIELLLVGLQAVQLVIMLVFPATAAILSILAFAMFLYLTVTLIKALHGFTNAFLVVLGMIGTLFVVGFALSFLALAVGITPEMITHEL